MLPKISVKVRPYRDTRGRPSTILAYVDLNIADAFAIKGIRIMVKRPGEPFVIFPAERRSDGGSQSAQQWLDIAHPLTAEARGACLRLIMTEYERVSASPPQ